MTENKKTTSEKELNKKTSAGEAKAITPIAVDYPQWYQDVIVAADLSENAPVRGCMIIKPYGYAIWEMIQTVLNAKIKAIGVKNAYFPLFIPSSFLQREAEHVEGFSPQVAVVTIGGGKQLEEPLIVRPTSETIIYDAYSRWIQSYRDLPMLINQWANVVRWETRPRAFLRTTEFLWQEGHTAHATAKEATDYALMILNTVYKTFLEEYLAAPVITGRKSEGEKFPGAGDTFTMEAVMQDGKALQMGTAHDLSDHFAKSFGIKFLDKDGQTKYAYNSSWGVTTRLIGAIIMMHGDDKGLVLPPKIAPVQAVVLPIAKEGDLETVAKAKEAVAGLMTDFRIEIDARDNLRLGEKHYEWEKKGVPVRIEIGPKDLANQSCVLVRRDTGVKQIVALKDLKAELTKLLEEIQKNIFAKAEARVSEHTKSADTWAEFEKAIEQGYVM
ncbi:MAG: proline--tRNA ligase, partial [bacterium]